MRYYYGTTDSTNQGKGRTITAKQLASLIKRDVEYGKWNLYNGGKQDNITATCRYQRKGFVYHERIFIYGKQAEFQELEKLLKRTNIQVIPRTYNNT